MGISLNLSVLIYQMKTILSLSFVFVLFSFIYSTNLPLLLTYNGIRKIYEMDPGP